MRLLRPLVFTLVVALASAQPDLRQRAIAAETAGDNLQARELWQQLSHAQPRQPEPWAHLGLLAARAEHFDEAIADYHKALTLGPALPSLRLNLALAHFKSGHMSEAAHELDALQSAFPADSALAQQARLLLGMARYGSAEYAAAVAPLREASRHDSGNLELRLTLAHACLWSKQWQCVLDVEHEILQLDANSAEADMLAGEALDGLKDHAGAIEQFRAAVHANPRLADAHFGLGYLLWTQRQYPEAATALQGELDLNPDHPQALLYLGDTQMQLNHPELAEPLLRHALRADARLALAHLDLGILLQEAGRSDEALAEMQSAVRMDPKDVNAHWRLGRLYRTLGHAAEAKAELELASSLTRSADQELASRMGQPPAQSTTH